MSDELKHCPFCGSRACIFRPNDVGCTNENCFAFSRLRHVNPSEWNARAELPAPDPMDDPRVMALLDALLEARPYVPDHHGPIANKIDAALAAMEPDNE